MIEGTEIIGLVVGGIGLIGLTIVFALFLFDIIRPYKY